MKLLDGKTLLAALGIVALGIAVGAVNNLTAGTSRRLEWSRDYPDPVPGKRNCPETLPAPGAVAEAGIVPVGVAPPPEAPAGGTLAAASAPEVPPPAGTTLPPAGDVTAPSGATADAAPAAATAVAPAATTTAAPVPAPAASASVPAVPPGTAFLELAPAQVDALFDRGALFVDARMTSQYEEGHVAGAISIPIWEAGVDAKVDAALFEVEADLSRPIVVYCNGGSCEDSHNLSKMFQERGHSAMYVYKDGYPDWLARNRPVRTGSAR